MKLILIVIQEIYTITPRKILHRIFFRLNPVVG